MRYVLKDDGYKWRAIYRGRKSVGRVWQHAETKVYHAMIGKTEATGSSFQDAFRNVAAKAMGFKSVQAVHDHNAGVQARRRAMNAAADVVFNEMLKGNYEPLGDVLETPQIAAAMVGPICKRILKR